MSSPEHKPEKTVDLSTATFIQDEHGIVHLTFKPYARIDYEEAEELLKVAGQLAGTHKYLILIDNSQPHTTTLKARRILSATDRVEAAAGIARNSMSAFLGNLWIKTVPTVYPSRIFTSKEDAVKWLVQYA